MDFQPISVKPADAQLVEVMQFTVEEVARIFQIPPHKIGHLAKSSFNNIEEQSIEYVQDCLLPWAVRFEQAIDMKVFRQADRGRYFVKFDLNALLRGDIEARKDFYREMLAHGVLSPNDVRRLEDMNPVEGGDVRMVQSNLIDIRYLEQFSQKISNEAQPTG